MIDKAGEIKGLGGVWGSQSGLLSVPELALLMELAAKAEEADSRPLLEVGHYYGLSTCGLVRATQRNEVVTVDHGLGDNWVGYFDDLTEFEKNRQQFFPDPRLKAIQAKSELLSAEQLDAFGFIFYDGDHGEEQRRFTEEVAKLTGPRWFVFDDRDFPVPSQCVAVLAAAGWTNLSPPLARLINDKTNPETMTLGVFRREA